MSKKKIHPQRSYVFGSSGSRIELDVDVHADIDYDFFDSGGKTANTLEPTTGLDDNPKTTYSQDKQNAKVNFAVHDYDKVRCMSGDNASCSNVEEHTTNKNVKFNDNPIVLTGNYAISSLEPDEEDAADVLCREVHKEHKSSLHDESVSLNQEKTVNRDCKVLKNEANVSDIKEVYNETGDVHIKTCTNTSLLLKSSELNKKKLMNCIAYSSSPGNDSANEEHFTLYKTKQIEPPCSDTDSASSDTTSEITDVTSRPTSSNYSLQMEDKVDKNVNRKPHKEKHTINTNVVGPHQSKQVVSSTSLVNSMRDMRIYDQRRDSTSTSSTYTSTGSSRLSFDSSRSRILPSRRNMTFTNDEMWKIERENECLLKKIEGKKNLRVKPKLAPVNFSLSSSAINRRKAQMQIDQENQRFVKKLKAIRAITSTSGPWRQVRY